VSIRLPLPSSSSRDINVLLRTRNPINGWFNYPAALHGLPLKAGSPSRPLYNDLLGVKNSSLLDDGAAMQAEDERQQQEARRQ